MAECKMASCCRYCCCALCAIGAAAPAACLRQLFSAASANLPPTCPPPLLPCRHGPQQPQLRLFAGLLRLRSNLQGQVSAAGRVRRVGGRAAGGTLRAAAFPARSSTTTTSASLSLPPLSSKCRYPYFSAAALSPSNSFFKADELNGCGQCFQIQCADPRSGGWQFSFVVRTGCC